MLKRAARSPDKICYQESTLEEAKCRPDTLSIRENDTRNQHFVTQGEQRLNALNPRADPKNQRIYSFQVVDRETLHARARKLDRPTDRYDYLKKRVL